ncbi:MAG TPA: hypothetical protein VK158_00955 [Acidobacteriota bacterium]|nr:hypothetical protein [Acidobacteriota bacterium]
MTETKKSMDRKFGPPVIALDDISSRVARQEVPVVRRPVSATRDRVDAHVAYVSTKTFDISTLLHNLSSQIRATNGGKFDLTVGDKRSYAGSRDSMLSSMDPGRDFTIVAAQSFDILSGQNKFGYVDVQIGTSEQGDTVADYEGFKLAIEAPFVIKKSVFNQRIGEVDFGFRSDKPLRIKYVALGDRTAYTKSYVRMLVGSRQINLNDAIPIQSLLRPEYAQKEVTVCMPREYLFGAPARLQRF